MKNKDKKANIDDKLFIFLFFLIIAGGFIKPLIMPHKIIAAENRTANIIPTFSLSGFKEKTYQNNYEKAYADQIPLASKMKIGIKTINLSAQKIYYSFLRKNEYHKLKGSVYLYNNNLVYTKYNFDKISKSLENKANNINSVADSLNDVDFYLYYIEKDTDINFEDNTKLNAYEYIKSNLSNKIKSDKFAINNFEGFQEYFYKTDHHWNYKGSYKGYVEIVKLLGIDNPLNYKEEVCLKSVMSGSKAGSIGGAKIFKEIFCAYTYDLPEHKTYINGKEQNYGSYKSVLKNEPETISYGIYYGWDNGLLEFDYNIPGKDNLLIIGESYDNAINELLASHFNKTYNIDLRAYEKDMKKSFDIYEFIKDKKIDKVLLVGNIDFYTSNTFLLKGAK